MDQLVSVNVAINILGTAKGVIEGGIVVQNLNEIQLECLPMDIPQSIDIDISHLDIGDSLRCEEIELDDKLNMKTPEDQIVISVTVPMKEEEVAPVLDEEDLEGDEALSEEGEESSDSDEDSGEDSEDKKTEE